MRGLDRKATLQVIRKVLKADFSCEERCFDEDGVFVYKAREMEGRRKFPFREKSLSIMTMGRGVVISCSSDRMEWVRENLGLLTRDQTFSASVIARLEAFVIRQGQFMAGPDLKYACSIETFRPSNLPDEIDVKLIEGADVQELYRYERFIHALSYRPDSPRPDVLATVAKHEGEVIGIAGASADCDKMWQIGVDVIPDYRGHGVGKTLVSELTKAIIRRVKVPYYSTTVSNIQSRALATGLGYWPSWVELYAREKKG